MPFLSHLPSLSAIHARLHWLPRLRGNLSLACNSDFASNSDRHQHTVRVYSLNAKAAAHPVRVMKVKGAVDRALEKVWPEVVEYATNEKVTGELWAQIRCVPSSAFADYLVTLGVDPDVVFTSRERQIPPRWLCTPPFAFTMAMDGMSVVSMPPMILLFHQLSKAARRKYHMTANKE
jgi:hypothetical protein